MTTFMITYTLTGRTRTRAYKPWFRPLVLILQVEEHHKGWNVDHTTWRDARLEDLVVPYA